MIITTLHRNVIQYTVRCCWSYRSILQLLIWIWLLRRISVSQVSFIYYTSPV